MCDNGNTLNEARDMMHEARSAFDAFMVMLGGAQALNQEGLYFLLRPVGDALHQVEDRLDLLSRHAHD